MDPEEFINTSIEKGTRVGLSLLSPLEQKIFVISELEIVCDMEGIDSFIAKFGNSGLKLAATAFHDIGADSIATLMHQLALQPTDNLLATSVNNLVTTRTGYDYEMLERYVAHSMT